MKLEPGVSQPFRLANFNANDAWWMTLGRMANELINNKDIIRQILHFKKDEDEGWPAHSDGWAKM